MDTTSQIPDPQPAISKSNPNFIGFMIYDAEDVKNMFRDLTVVNPSCQTSAEESTSNALMTGERMKGLEEVIKDLKVSSAMTCYSCKTEFPNQTEQRAHFKTEWHRHNLKEKLKGVAPISLEEFDAIESQETVQEEVEKSPKKKCRRPKPSGIPGHLSGKISPCPSSSSSTDSEDDLSSDMEEDVDNKKNPKVFFKNGAGKILAIYRCILHGKQNYPSHDGELIRSVCSLNERLNWAIILIGGGHFAASIFNGKDVVIHKTFHRYTVRGKQGSGQSSRDGRQSGHAPRSGGASLRRQNEATLVQDVQSLMEIWDEHLKRCHAVFFRAPGSNKTILFGGKAPPFKKSDDRLRPIPFPTCRATFQEVQRIHRVLSTINCYDTIEAAVSSSYKVPPLHSCRSSPVHKPKKSKDKGTQITLAQKMRQAEPPSDTFPGATDSDEEIKLLGFTETYDTNELKMFDSSETRGKRKNKKRSKES